LIVPGGGLPASPGTVTDLAVAAVTPNSVTLSFTEVDDGLGQPAQYAVRFAEPSAWGTARDVTEGTCATPVSGRGVGTRLTCTVLGLAPTTTYAFQVQAYRSTLDVVVVSGDPSNFTEGTTTCDCWTTRARMPNSRYALAAADVNGTLYAVGGYRCCVYPAAVEAYDPARDTWTTRASLPTPRKDLGAATVGGILYAVGGNNRFTSTGGPVGTVEAYDPATDTWTTKAPMPTARHRLGVAAVDGIIYAVGGIDAAGNILTTLEVYDPATDTWTTKAPMPTARADFGIAVVNGVLYAVGAYNSATVEAYDPLTDTWTTKAPMPTALRSVAAAGMDGVLYAVDNSDLDVKALRTYDPASDTWTEKAPMTRTTMRSFGVAAIDGRLYAVGDEGWGYLKMYQP
jgi:N-acetylneuraminic acid mutarotase